MSRSVLSCMTNYTASSSPVRVDRANGSLDQTISSAHAISPARHAGQSPTQKISLVIRIEPKNATCRIPYHALQVSLICKNGCQFCRVDELALRFSCTVKFKRVFVSSVQQLIRPVSQNGRIFPCRGILLSIITNFYHTLYHLSEANKHKHRQGLA